MEWMKCCWFCHAIEERERERAKIQINFPLQHITISKSSCKIIHTYTYILIGLSETMYLLFISMENGKIILEHLFLTHAAWNAFLLIFQLFFCVLWRLVLNQEIHFVFVLNYQCCVTSTTLTNFSKASSTLTRATDICYRKIETKQNAEKMTMKNKWYDIKKISQVCQKPSIKRWA